MATVEVEPSNDWWNRLNHNQAELIAGLAALTAAVREKRAPALPSAADYEDWFGPLLEDGRVELRFRSEPNGDIWAGLYLSTTQGQYDSPFIEAHSSDCRPLAKCLALLLAQAISHQLVKVDDGCPF